LSTLRIETPRAFLPLLQPARYKGAYGGRGGAKSHFFAELLLERCYAERLRAVCIREIQHSLRDSVRQLLVDKIQKLGLGTFFEVLDAEIRGRNGSLIIFRGMQSYNAETIKSLEAYDIAWVEEAQTLSEVSLSLLRPTIRKEDSELWFSWNPRHRTDPVDLFLRKRRPANAVVIPVNWRDNPWFPEVLRAEMLGDKEADPDMAEHVWEGAYGMQHGAILSRWVDRAERDGRISDAVEYESDGRGIEISSDIGYRDTATWWFWQRRINGFALLDYDGDSGLDAGDWIERLQNRLNERKWKLAKIWLPHDATHRVFQTKHSAVEQFAKAFGLGKIGVVPLCSVANRINAARTVIKKCEFHKTRCETGLDGLRAWRYDWNPDTQTFSREPVHDAASHPSDGYSYGCQVMQTLPAPEPVVEKPIRGLNDMTFDELIAAQQPAKARV
jgi:phage terminase large subunit